MCFSACLVLRCTCVLVLVWYCVAHVFEVLVMFYMYFYGSFGDVSYQKSKVVLEKAGLILWIMLVLSNTLQHTETHCNTLLCIVT